MGNKRAMGAGAGLSISGSVPGHALRTEMDGALRKIGMTTGFVTPQTTNAVLMNWRPLG